MQSQELTPTPPQLTPSLRPAGHASAQNFPYIQVLRDSKTTIPGKPTVVQEIEP
jgi:hypothetical protein